jgi:cytochrome c biogenesis protein CcmG/thiol:disulfide interchange protein DsbE
MTFLSPPVVTARLSILILFFIFIGAASSPAEDIPDSLDVIRANLPDSVSLDGKVVYVDFWASWCMPCRLSFPWMQKLYTKYHNKGLEIVAVGVDKEHRSALKFLDDTKPTFPIIFDSTGSLAKRYELEAMPSSFVYGRDGRLRARNRGFRQEEADSLDKAILELLNERGSR